MGTFDNLRQQVEKQIAEHPDQVEKLSDEGIERGGDLVDKLTGGKHAEQVDQAQRAADERIGE